MLLCYRILCVTSKKNSSFFLLGFCCLNFPHTKKCAMSIVPPSILTESSRLLVSFFQLLLRIIIKTMNICRECNKNFSNKYILATHLRNIHGPTRERNFCCNFESSGVKCTKRFMTKHHLAKVCCDIYALSLILHHPMTIAKYLK